jgi:uncharacterized protein (AIM24 family)
MTNEEANFCGRCGGPLRASAIILADDDDEIGHSASGVIPEQPGLPLKPPELQQLHVDDSEPAPLDLGAIGMFPQRGDQPLLHRPFIAAPWQELPPLTTPTADASEAFEAVLPSLSEQAGADAAALEPTAAEDVGALPQDAAPARAEPPTMPVEMQAAATTGDLLRVGGCTVRISDGPASLVEVRLETGAVLTMAAEGLVWAQERVALSTLRNVPGRAGNRAFGAAAAYFQAVGPGELALAGAMAATVTPLELRSGSVLDLADGAALAWTRGVRAWRLGQPGSFPAMRLAADRSALVLLQCLGNVQYLDLGPGDRLAVSPRALLATAGMIDCARLCHHRGEGPALVDYRLIGPGRVVLGAKALPGTGA